MLLLCLLHKANFVSAETSCNAYRTSAASDTTALLLLNLEKFLKINLKSKVVFILSI